jgi:dipeptidyl aminopeptidase/acylaminoacyl peptidase
LIGRNPDDATVARFSTDQHVTHDTPPLYIIHGDADKGVPVANANLLADAAEKAGVAHDLLILPNAPHGFAMGGGGGPTSVWFDLCLKWLAEQHAVHLAS